MFGKNEKLSRTTTMKTTSLIPMLVTSAILTIQSLTAQAVYHRGDGGVTVVEQGQNILGQRTTDVRRYDNQSDYVQGEYATELALAQIALQVAVEAAPHVEKAWTDFKRDFKAGWEAEEQKRKKQQQEAAATSPMFPLVRSVNKGSLAEKVGIEAGDYILFYDGSSLGWATTWNNPLKFKVDKAREAGTDKCEIVILRDGKRYVSKVPGGVYIGVNLTEATPPDLIN